MTPGRVWIQIAAYKPELGHATLEFRGTMLRRHAGRLRQLTDPYKVVRIQQTDSVNEVVAGACPALARGFVADVVSHGGGARRENREIRAARALQFQLRILQAVANLIVGDFFLCVERYIDAGL